MVVVIDPGGDIEEVGGVVEACVFQFGSFQVCFNGFLDADVTGSSHLHCIRVWVFWCGEGVVEGMFSAVWGMKELIG